MSESPVKLYEPIATLKPVDDNIGTVDGPLVHMQIDSLPGQPLHG